MTCILKKGLIEMLFFLKNNFEKLILLYAISFMLSSQKREHKKDAASIRARLLR
jgi:hypothetical protein